MFVTYKEEKKGHDESSKDTFKFYDGLSDAVMEENVELLDEDRRRLAERGFAAWRWGGRGGR